MGRLAVFPLRELLPVRSRSVLGPPGELPFRLLIETQCPHWTKSPASAGLFFSSSYLAGEGCLDLEEEVFIVPEAVGGALDHLDTVVDAFDEAGVQRPAGVGKDAVQIGLEALGKAHQWPDA